MIAALAAAACGGGAGHGGATLSSSWQAPDGLAYVPADTPYLFTALDNRADLVDDLAMSGLGSAIATIVAKNPEPQTEIEKLGLATLRQLANKSRAQIYQQLGLAPHAHILIYGAGLAPVARIALADPKPLRDLLGNAATLAKAGHTVPAAGPTAWAFASDDFALGLAVTDGELVVVVTAANAVDALLASQVRDRPAQAMRSADVIALADHFGVATAYLGMLDTQRFVAALEKQTTIVPPFKLLIPENCRADAEWLAHLAPRTVFGYSRADEHGFDASLFFELAPEIAKGLDTLHVAMPEPHPASSSSLGSLETAIDLDAAMGWLRAGLALAALHPMTCPQLSEWNETIADLRKEAGKPLPEEIRGLRGMEVVVDDASISPPGGAGYALVAGTDLGKLLQLVTQRPELAGLQFGLGKPVELPTKSLGVNVKAYLGASSTRAVLAVGPDSEQRVSAELSSPARERAPLFALTMDLAALEKKFPDTMDLGKSSPAFARLASESIAVDIRASSIVVDVTGTMK